jgi:hypothetical protein
MFHDPIAVEKFKQLVLEFNIIALVETGTDKGHGAYEAAKIVTMVHTIDNDESKAREAESLWAALPHRGLIIGWCGNSPSVMRTLIPQLPPRICFYLDAHGAPEYWPLLDELKVIAEAKIKHCPVIIIHDFKVPGKPWGFDSYNGQDLDLDYVLPSLNKINPQFKLVYNQEAEGNKRGILYALP